MALPLIGHASIGEDGTAKVNKAGDQTKGEVCVRKWYQHSKDWGYILRPKDKKVAEAMAKCMEEACANDCIGYDQTDRLTLWEAVKNNGFKCDKKSLTKKVECDCSALVRVCMAYAGIKVENFRTATQVEIIMASKKFKKIKFKNVNQLKRGDIVVTKEVPGHTAIVLTDAIKEVTNNAYVGKEIGTAISKTTMNIRSGASTAYKVYDTIPKGTKVKVLEIKSNGWYKIVWTTCKKGYAFVSNSNKEYFTYSAKPTFKTHRVKINCDVLNVRKDPTTSSKIVTQVQRNEVYTIVAEKNGWGKLKSGVGWIHLGYTKPV
jgi:uncharacterized protein YgiM (DUF1202 family)